MYSETAESIESIRYTAIFLPSRSFQKDRLDELLELELRVREKIARAARSVGLENEVISNADTLGQNFADRREEIEALRAEETEYLKQGGSGAAAFSSEEFR